MTDPLDIEKEYLSSLSDLNWNSKPLILMLTDVAAENIDHAQVIVDAIIKHINKTPPEMKLPVLYLIDSIVKNLGKKYDGRYLDLFSRSIVNIFCDVFQEVNEKVRAKMFALRQTWNNEFSQSKLYALDIKTNALDPGWPITAKFTPSIHVNPNFFKSKTSDSDILREKERELLELQKRKLELELAATKKHIAEQEKQLQTKTALVPTVSTNVPHPHNRSQPVTAESSGNNFTNTNYQYQSIDMIQPKAVNAESAPQNVRPRDPRLARQMQFQNSAQRNVNQRNRTASPVFANQGFGSASIHFVPNSQVDNAIAHRPAAAFNAAIMDDSSRKSRTASKNRSSSKEVKTRSTSKTSPKSQKPNSQKSSPKSPASSSSRSSSRSSKSSPSSNHQSPKDQKKNRNKETESKSVAIAALAEAERIKEFTIPKKRSPSPKDKSITDPKVSSTTKTADSPTKVIKASKSNSKSRNNARHTRGGGESVEIVQPETVPSTTSVTAPTIPTTTTSESIESPIPPSIEPVVNVPAKASCVPLPGAGENQSFKNNVIDVPSKDIDLRLMLSTAGSSPISTTSFGSSLSATPSSVEARKRSEDRSVEEPPEQKKRKTEKIDGLFGKEDVDLRTQLSQAITPLFPPAVLPSGEEKPDWATIKADTPKSNKSNFDAVRAKLAEASRHLPNKPNRNNDIDLRRRHIRNYIEDSQDGSDATFKIILAQAQVQLDNDDMNLEQYNTLMQQVAQAHTKSKKESLKRKNDLVSRSGLSMDNNDHFSSSSSDSNNGKSSRNAKRDRRDSDGPDNVSSKENRSNRNHKSSRRRTSKWSSRDKSQNAMLNFQQQPSSSRQFNVQHVWQDEQPMFPPNMMMNNPYMINAIPSNIPCINNQRTINIDGIPREIRFYDEVAIAFMKENGGEPKEIGFQSGERRVLVDNKDSIVLAFNDSYKPFKIDGVKYQIRFGSPIRELYINNMWYECFFGDPPTNITLDGRIRQFKIEGPSPQVRIGNLRTDLVVGKIDLYVDVHVKVSLYLDAQVQHFELDNQKHTVQFADYFLTVLIDGEQFGVEYGGMPKKIRFGGRDHYIRFSIMPDGVVPGMMYIKNMLRTERHRGIQSPLPTVYTELIMPLIPSVSNVNVMPEIAAVAPVLPAGSVNEVPLTSMVPAAPSINIDDLFQKLLASGILNNTTKAETKEKSKEKPKTISLAKPDTLKYRQQTHIHVLFSGMQCSSCGVRFPPEQTVKYSQHLDWHFRQNRRDRDSTRRAHSRRWYYNVEDWIQYEEIEDLDERERNWFETQQMEMDMANDDSAQRNESPVPSCVAGPEDVDKTCDMCHDQFETFYNEENEEWHLRNAIRVDDRTYHPICFEDCKTSETLDESSINNGLHGDNAVELALKTETADESVDRILLDDDDDVIVLPQEEPVITEIVDDDDTPTVSSSIVTVEKIDSTSQDGASTSGAVTSSTNDDVNATYESIGNESDLQILVPQISVVDVEDFEDKPIDSTIQLPVKIKEEPKDDGYDEDDAFEDIGTFEEATTIEDNSADGFTPVAIVSTTPNTQPAPSTHQTQASMYTSLDGHVQLQDAAPATIGMNKIKINITKNVTKTAIKASDSNLGKQSELAATKANVTDKNKEEEEQEITFEYKDTMKGANFKKLPAVRSGTETSGLCTIM
ncbi:uncharacterized protein LOC119078281 [Bradysia coprophila]|uniref:uncharacterized protein LOC119078281 n=1 Tax=Bradysia coprophila TaxID=38358 RepID=UPI00187DADEC|nr:uncharacterized protein LOC119078281 [Bradysia coprophila]